MSRILILGGTTEAVALAKDLAAKPGIDAIYSLAGRTRAPTLPDCTIRTGGFGGINGLTRYLKENHIAAVIDATHPYAEQMAGHAQAATKVTEIPLFKFLRPAWREPADTSWHHVATAADAARIIDGKFSRVFLSSGLKDLTAFSHLPDIWFLVRSVDMPDTPIALPQHHHVAARGPFTEEGETDLLRTWQIDALVTKNSGGAATAAKLEAARALAIAIIVIDRPANLEPTPYTDVKGLLESVSQTLG